MRRALPLGALALTALVAGLLVGSAADSGRATAPRATSPAPGNAATTRAMHDLLSRESQKRFPLRSFRAAYENAALGGHRHPGRRRALRR